MSQSALNGYAEVGGTDNRFTDSYLFRVGVVLIGHGRSEREAIGQAGEEGDLGHGLFVGKNWNKTVRTRGTVWMSGG